MARIADAFVAVVGNVWRDGVAVVNWELRRDPPRGPASDGLMSETLGTAAVD
jgi:hypothetical protein